LRAKKSRAPAVAGSGVDAQLSSMPTSPPAASASDRPCWWTAPLRPFVRFGGGLLDRALCVLGAVGLSQAPEFFQQYLQRLGGHLDEARLALAGFEKVARESGMTFQQYLDLLRAQPVDSVAKTGERIAEMQARVDTLARAESALREAGAWERPFVFLRQVDWDIAGRAWEVFRPAVPVTLEGALYAGAGMVLALLLFQGCVAWPCRALARRWKKSRSAPAGD
jgi:hypothetical protein